MSTTHIQWAEKVWNPTTGCDKVSAGCKNCYAIPFAWRHMHNKATRHLYEGTVAKTPQGKLNWTGKLNIIDANKHLPVSWKKPCRIFVNSMSDLFHKSVDFQTITDVFCVMLREAPQHTYIILTKRPERMATYINHMKVADKVMYDHFQEHGQNIWLLTSVEDQATAEERCIHMTNFDAPVKGLSIEPLLGPINFNFAVYKPDENPNWREAKHILTYFNWLIIGGESGHGARPCKLDWIKMIVQSAQHEAPGAAIFVKQMGSMLSKEFGMSTPKGDVFEEFPKSIQIREYPL